jgi:hypothetical protein
MCRCRGVSQESDGCGGDEKDRSEAVVSCCIGHKWLSGVLEYGGLLLEADVRFKALIGRSKGGCCG